MHTSRTLVPPCRPHHRGVHLAIVTVVALAAALLTFATGQSGAGAASCAAPSKCEYDLANHHNNGGTAGCAKYSATPRPATSGRGCFENDGDILYLTDSAEDGYGMGMQWHTTDGRRAGICRYAGGVTITTGQYNAYGCDKDFPESTRISYRVGRCDGDRHNCRVASGYVDEFGTSTWGAWQNNVPVK